MNREEAKELLPIIQAYADGKKIEYSNDGYEQSETETPTWDTDFVYRIKSEPKFDPNTLKPFDKVLVRDECDNIWRCAIFSHRNGHVFPYFANSAWYKWCIPYNDDTKHLVGTTEEAPEFYRYWDD